MVSRIRVAVLGGGLQGCCIALVLARRGVEVTLFDKNARLLSRAATANEGKIHLGYTYGADAGLATARMMQRGALAFAPFLERYVGLTADQIQISSPCVYIVHRDSQRTRDETRDHIAAVHRLVAERAGGIRGNVYFGRDLGLAPREWSDIERDGVFDPAMAVAAFTTQEVAVQPESIAEPIRKAIAREPHIALRLQETVLGVEEKGERLRVVTGSRMDPDDYDYVVNALWDGRLAIDATLGLKPAHPWLHRVKYGVTFRLPEGMAPPPTVTIVLGPFGDLVNYRDGTIYISWYPACMREISDDLVPPDWPVLAEEPVRSEILAGSIAGLSRFLPLLSRIDVGDLVEALVRGGAITAWGRSDIDDPQSGLHRRSEIGILRHGRYYSIDPGKLTMAPYFAELCAERLLGG